MMAPVFVAQGPPLDPDAAFRCRDRKIAAFERRTLRYNFYPDLHGIPLGHEGKNIFLLE